VNQSRQTSYQQADKGNALAAEGRRILVIEDDPDISHLLEINLRDSAFRVDVVNNGVEGLQRASNLVYQLIVLDLMLPGLDGLEICKRLRGQAITVPILMLTAKTSEFDRVLGLELGADDYLTKPFSVMELQARVKAILRRVDISSRSAATDDETIASASLLIDVGGRNVSINGRAVELTAKEFDLLIHFANNPDRVFRRAELLDSVWGYGHDGYEHTVNSHINRLRAKIENDPTHPELIVTVWGVGYKMHSPTGAVRST